MYDTLFLAVCMECAGIDLSLEGASLGHEVYILHAIGGQGKLGSSLCIFLELVCIDNQISCSLHNGLIACGSTGVLGTVVEVEVGGAVDEADHGHHEHGVQGHIYDHAVYFVRLELHVGELCGRNVEGAVSGCQILGCYRIGIQHRTSYYCHD